MLKVTVKWTRHKVRQIDKSKFLQKNCGTLNGALSIGNNKMTSLAEGTNNNDAVNLKRLHSSSITPVVNTSTGTSNVFGYLMEDPIYLEIVQIATIVGIMQFPNSPHKIDHRAYLVRFPKSFDTAHTGVLKLSLAPLTNGKYTIVTEIIPKSQLSVFTNLATDSSPRSNVTAEFIG